MKFTLPNLKLGESLKGRIHEVLPGGDLIVSFSGDLLRVQNESNHLFAAGDSVTLIVRALQPLRFQLVAGRPEPNRRGRFNVSI